MPKTYKIVLGQIDKYPEGTILTEDDVKGWDLQWLLGRGVLEAGQHKLIEAQVGPLPVSIPTDQPTQQLDTEQVSPVGDSPATTISPDQSEDVSPTGDSETRRGPGRPPKAG